MAIKNYLFVDFETFFSKEYSLRLMSTPEYILDKQFEVLLLAVLDMKDRIPRIIQAVDIPEFLKQYPPEETFCCSHNALFDLSILSWKYGWVAGRLQDTLGMVRALRRYKRNSLEAVAKELLGASLKGNTIYKVIGLNAQGIKNAGMWPEYCSYAMNDVRICSFIYRKLIKEFPEEEQQVMDLVLRAAIEPTLHANVPLLQTHLDDLRKRKAQILRECGYDKAALMSTASFKDVLENLGVEIKTKVSATGRIVPAFSKSDPFMAELADYQEADDDTNYKVQTLAMARLSHKSTIEETRAEKFVNIAKLPWGNPIQIGPDTFYNKSPHLLPVALRYGGAHTHRLSGEWGMNMQNLPRDKAKSKLREALVAPPGYKLITADLAQIEARIVAQLCEQKDLLAQFRQNDDVYANFGTKLFGKHVDKINTPNERWIAKTAVLGLGYGCGVKRFDQMVVTSARQYGILLDGLYDKKIAERTVETYRRTFNRITASWQMLEQCRIDIINNRNKNQKHVWGPVTIRSKEIVLPNGLLLQYEIGDKSLYGAKILENITQALARIIVMQAAVRLDQKALRFVMQSHDELVFVVPNTAVGDDIKQIIIGEMIRPPTWMPNIPLAVEIGVGQDYGSCK